MWLGMIIHSSNLILSLRFSDFSHSSLTISPIGDIVVTGIIELVIGYLLIFKTDTIITKITKNESTTVNISSNKIDLLEVGLAIISVLLLTYSLAELLSYFVESTYYQDHQLYHYIKHTKLVYYALCLF